MFYAKIMLTLRQILCRSRSSGRLTRGTGCLIPSDFTYLELNLFTQQQRIRFIGAAAVALSSVFGAWGAPKAHPRVFLDDNPAVVSPGNMRGLILETPAYRWVADSIIQGPYKAYAPSDTVIISDYHARPGYFMPVEHEWRMKNDLSEYPRLSSSNKLANAIFNMGLDEMVNAVEPDTTLRTGKEWAGVWTRDVSYSIILSMAILQPEASRISLEHKISPEGTIIQDTGSGGAWPVSSDREIWAVAAYEVYKTTGDEQWLRRIYPVIRKSLETDWKTLYDPETGLIRGETSFIDWREQSYPRWMQTADIYQSEALGTSVVHAQAWQTLADIARRLGHGADAGIYEQRAATIRNAINSRLWLPSKGIYAMYLYGRDNLVVNPRAETLGESLAILYDVADAQRSKLITEKNPITPFGPAIFFPQISDMPSYHNNALWPFVASYWALANAKASNSRGALLGLGSVFRPAALFATNKENFNLDNGDIYTELNSSNMLWSLSGNLAVTLKMLFGIRPAAESIDFAPFIPKALDDNRTLTGLRYRDMVLNITISGYGNRIASFRLNGKPHSPSIAADLKGEQNVEIRMDNNTPPPMKVNETANVKAPLTPVAWLTYGPDFHVGIGTDPHMNLLQWQPIEYIAYYKVLRDGKVVAQTRETQYHALEPGEYQVVGVSAEGVESFASEPRSNRIRVTAEMPVEKSKITSAEAQNVPASPLRGFYGSGFAEIDHTTKTIYIGVDVPQTGYYSIALRYANGNGSVNTENKCAIRTLLVDGKDAGTVVMPQRGSGNWNDWGMTNSVEMHLSEGHHVIALQYRPENENMNFHTNHALVDRVVLSYLGPVRR